MEQFVLDPAMLRRTAELIRMYCQAQKHILDQYVGNISALNSEWCDDETFSEMFESICQLKVQSQNCFDEMLSSYPGWFEAKAEFLDSRPAFGQTGYVPSSHSQGTVSSATPSIVVNEKAHPSGIVFREGPFGNGMHYAAGEHYDNFLQYITNTSDYEVVDSYDANGKGQIVNIRARDIEGIYLNENDVADPIGFWTGHGRNGYSQAAILQKASMIPKVRAAIASGKTTTELESDDELCGSSGCYFSRPIQVRKLGDFFVFCFDGRHRTLAAQSLDMTIPVEVIGEYVRR